MDSTTMAKLRQYRDPSLCEYTQKIVFSNIPTADEITSANVLMGEALAAPAGQPEPHVFWSLEEDERALAYSCAFMAKNRTECIEEVFDAYAKEAYWADTAESKRILSNPVQRQLKAVAKGAVGKEAVLNYLLHQATTADPNTGKIAWPRDSLPVFLSISLPDSSAAPPTRRLRLRPKRSR